MAEVTDDMLMAYADGSLSALDRAKVEAVLQAYPEARRRVEIFRATGAPIAKLYDKPMTEPVPAYLRDFVLNFPINDELPKAGSAQSAGLLEALTSKAAALATGLADWLGGPTPQAARWQFATAAAAILALGAGAGVLLQGEGGSNELVAFHDGHIYASGTLRNVLEMEPSREDTRIGGVRGEAVTMRASLTFKSKEQAYCRQYEIATTGAGGFVGLGCRDHNGNWGIEVHLPSKGSAKGGIKTAGGAENDTLDAIVDRMIDGDALGTEQEAEAIKGGWK